MGIKDVRTFNGALLAKWKWRLLSEGKGNGKIFFLSQYDPELGHSQINMKSQSWWWRDLSKSCGEGEDGG